jgi:uncharacterized paraquat-inducible protein A
MALTTCKECGGQVSSEAAACPHCGYQLKQQATSGSSKFGLGCLVLIGLAIVLPFITAIILYLSGAMPQ